MSAFRRPIPVAGTSHPHWRQGGVATLDGTDTTTTITFKGQASKPDLKNMANATYECGVHPLGAHTVAPWVSARATTGITLTHDNNASISVSWWVEGEIDHTS